MKSFATRSFWKEFASLKQGEREQAKKLYRLWLDNPLHPSLHFKKVKERIWSIRVNTSYRALALQKDDNFYWFWIGNHREYERILSRS